MSFRKFHLAVAATLLAIGASAQADEVYGGVTPYGLTLGYAYPINEQVTVRADVNGGFSYSRNGKESGVDYAGKFKNQALGLYADWFPADNAFRLTGGLNVNNTTLRLRSRASDVNATATINGKEVDFSSGDTYLNANARLARVTPYIGIGWGHKMNSEKGWGFYADLGVRIGKFKINRVEQNITETTQGNVTQADVDAEVRKAQDGLNKLKVLPVLGIGAIYRF